jgi:hypothetical protein
MLTVTPNGSVGDASATLPPTGAYDSRATLTMAGAITLPAGSTADITVDCQVPFGATLKSATLTAVAVGNLTVF